MASILRVIRSILCHNCDCRRLFLEDLDIGAIRRTPIIIRGQIVGYVREYQ